MVEVMERMLMKAKKRFSLKKKLLCWFTFCICIPIILFFFVIFGYETAAANQELERNANKEAALLSEQLDWFFRSIQHISKNYYNSALINELVSPEHSHDKMQFLEDQLALLELRKVNNYILANMQLHVTVITTDGYIYGTELYNMKIFDMEKMRQTRWYRQLMENPWNILWIQDSLLSELIHDTEQEKVYNIWTLKSPSTYEPIGFLIVGFTKTDLQVEFNGYFDTDELFVLQDSYENDILCYGPAEEEDYERFLAAVHQQDNFEMPLNGMDYYAVRMNTKVNGWKLTLMTPRNSVLNGSNTLIRISGATLIYFFALALLFLLFISKALVHPVQSLMQAMRAAQSGNLTAHPYLHRNDEIGELADTYNDLINQIQNLMDNIIIEQEQKRKAELQALYAQINPHFIINTLTSIRSLVYFGDREAADKAIQAFAYLLKNTLSREDEMWTIGQEIKLIKNLLQIYQLSFESSISISWEVDPALTGCMIIKMITQPVVENAVIHGLKAKDGDKSLKFKICAVNNRIDIMIKDNGVGCDEQHEFHQINMEFDKNIGMQNVYNRIALRHGPQYGLSFHSLPGIETTVTLHLPLIQEKEAPNDW